MNPPCRIVSVSVYQSVQDHVGLYLCLCIIVFMFPPCRIVSASVYSCLLHTGVCLYICLIVVMSPLFKIVSVFMIAWMNDCVFIYV